MMENTEQIVELQPFDFEACENLNNNVEEFFLNKGIISTMSSAKIDAPINEEQGSNAHSAESDVNAWLKPFKMEHSRKAFYLDINGADGIDKWNKAIYEGLTSLIDEVNGHLKDNESRLGESASKKLQHYKSMLIRARKAFKIMTRSVKKEFEQSCTTVDDIRKVVARKYASFFKDRLLEPIIISVYDGVKMKQGSITYQWLANKIREFLTQFGVITLNIDVGDKFDFDGPYDITDDSCNNITNNEIQNECVKEIYHYAYAFQEDDNYWPIMNGLVSVWKYEKG